MPDRVLAVLVALQNGIEMSIRILLVDDHPIVAVQMKGLIESPTIVVDTAMNGEEALELFSLKLHHLVITDLEMPVMGGMELIQKLRLDRPDLCIIAMSSGKESERSAIAAGATAFFQKPIPLDSLKQIMALSLLD